MLFILDPFPTAGYILCRRLLIGENEETIYRCGMKVQVSQKTDCKKLASPKAAFPNAMADTW